MKHIKNITPASATHPGEVLLDEMQANGYSQVDFANLIGMQKTQLNEIIKGKRDINADTALLLEKALGIDAEYWMELQKNYALDKARIEAKNKTQLEAIEIWNIIKTIVPISFFKKVQAITGDLLNDIQKIKQIYGVKNIEELATVSIQSNFARFRKSTKLKSDAINIIGWVKYVQFISAENIVSPFNHESEAQLINGLKEILLENNNVLARTEKLLAENGIKFIIQAKGEKTPIDGISYWSNGNPAIGMTLRYKRLDNFAFTLFHELGHIYKHLVNNNQKEFIDLDIRNEEEDYLTSKEEIEANSFSQNYLINEQDWNKYLRLHQNLESDKAIIPFAKEIKIHPSILRGRVCHHLKNFSSFTRIVNEIG